MKQIKNKSTNWVKTVFIYGSLIAGSIIFAWPLLWMAGVSIKTGKEIVSSPTSFLPGRPIPQQKSPYFDVNEFPSLSKEAASIFPIVEKRLRELDYSWPDYVTANEAVPLITKGICLKLEGMLPQDTWKLSHNELSAAISARVKPELIQSVIEQVKREFCLGSLRVRSLDIQEQELIPNDRAQESWTIENSQQATMVKGFNGGKACGIVRYDLGNVKSVRFSQVFTTNFSMDRFYRLQLSLRNDESWNALDVYVEMQGALYKSSKPAVFGDSGNWSVLTWQRPGEDETTNKVRVWLPLKEIDHGPQYISTPNQLKVTLELRKVNGIQACWYKVRHNYDMALDYIPFWRYLATSLFLTIMTVSATLFSCSMIAYSFARLKWPGRNLCFILMLATLMIPSQITMIPQFLIIRDLGWYNTLLPLWVPHLFGSAFYIFLLVQFLKGIPKDLEDAARIDGCGFFRIYWHIMIPLVKPTLVAIAVLTFVGTWNDFMGPLIYVSDQQLYPLSFGLYAFTVQVSSDVGQNMSMTMAGALLMTLPIIVLFFFAQRYFIQGVTLSGLK